MTNSILIIEYKFYNFKYIRIPKSKYSDGKNCQKNSNG